MSTQPTIVISDNDDSELERLRSALSGATRNTEIMLTKLSKFESHLETMESELKPLQESTASLITAKERISATLVEVGKTHKYFRVASEVKSTAYQPYSKDREGEIFDAIDSLSNAKTFFENHREIRSAGSVLMQINQLLTSLVGACVKEVTRYLDSVGSTLEERNESFEYKSPLREDKLNHVQPILDMLVRIGSSEHLKLYKSTRAVVIEQDIARFLRLRDNSRAFSALVLGDSMNGGHVVNENDIFGRFILFSTELLRGEVALWSVLISHTAKAVDVFVDLCMLVVDRLKSAILPYILDISKNSGSGGNNNDSIKVETAGATAARSKHDLMLIRLELLRDLEDHFDNLYEVCKPDFRHESQASLALLQLKKTVIYACVKGLDAVSRDAADPGPVLSPEMKDKDKDKDSGAHEATELFNMSNAGEKCNLLHVCSETLHSCGQCLRLGPLISKVNQLAVPVGLTNVPPSLRNCPALVMSLLNSLKTNLKQRAEFIEAAVFVLASRGFKKKEGMAALRDTLVGGGGSTVAEAKRVTTGMSMTSLVRDSMNPKASLENSLHTTHLYENERDKAEAELAMLSACPHLFLVNNLIEVEAFLNEHDADLHACTDPMDAGFVDVYAQEVQQTVGMSKKGFCETVAASMGMLAKDEEDFNTKYSTMPSGDKQGKGRLVKGRFSLFNSGLEALLSQQGAWKVSTPALRDELGQQLASLIYPAYNSFHRAYSTTNFSRRHMDLYVKFSPSEVQSLLLRFFGGAGTG